MFKNRPKPVVLIILDGWGVAAVNDNNAVTLAETPNFDRLIANYPAMTLKVPGNQAGSEAGHFHIGTGQGWTENGQPATISLPGIISRARLSQFYIAETEKYAPINYFFKGCREERMSGETLELVPSPHLSSPAEEPALAAKAVAKSLVKRIINDNFDFLAANFANPHLVANSHDRAATVKAIEVVDKCLGKIIKSILAKDGILLVTADHGRAEELGADHPSLFPLANPVPLIIVANNYEGRNFGHLETPNGDLSLLEPAGELIDIAPTILKIMGLAQPTEMKGHSLI
ncbi:MAG: hypothetical protein V1692_02240 [bacterium]